MSLTLLAHASMPVTFWAEAVHTTVYLIKHLPSPLLEFVSPYQKLFNKPPQYDFLKIFGCACFPYLRPYNNKKLQFRSLKCIFLGYSLNQKGYRYLDPSTGWVFLSRLVVFDETTFPYSTLHIQTTRLSSLPSGFAPIIFSPTTLPLTTVSSSPSTPPAAHAAPPLPEPMSNITSAASLESASPLPSPMGLVSPSPLQVVVPTTHLMVTQGKTGIRKPGSKYALMINVSPNLVEPSNFSQANKQDHWRKAMQVEYIVLQQAKTWTLVPHTPSMNVLPKKWVYHIKLKSNGTIERYKARLVANGFHQQPESIMVRLLIPWLTNPPSISFLLLSCIVIGPFITLCVQTESFTLWAQTRTVCLVSLFLLSFGAFRFYCINGGLLFVYIFSWDYCYLSFDLC